MSETLEPPASPLMDQLEIARRQHANVFADYLGAPSRALRLELERASEAHREILADYHGVPPSELAILPEEQKAYTSEFTSGEARKDAQDSSAIFRVARAMTAIGALGYIKERIASGDLYSSPLDIVVVAAGAAAIIGISPGTESAEREHKWLIEDPFELTNEVINSAGRSDFFPKYDTQNHRFVDLNFRRQVRRQLLSRRRRVLSTAFGQL